MTSIFFTFTALPPIYARTVLVIWLTSTATPTPAVPPPPATPEYESLNITLSLALTVALLPVNLPVAKALTSLLI